MRAFDTPAPFTITARGDCTVAEKTLRSGFTAQAGWGIRNTLISCTEYDSVQAAPLSSEQESLLRQLAGDVVPTFTTEQINVLLALLTLGRSRLGPKRSGPRLWAVRLLKTQQLTEQQLKDLLLVPAADNASIALDSEIVSGVLEQDAVTPKIIAQIVVTAVETVWFDLPQKAAARYLLHQWREHPTADVMVELYERVYGPLRESPGSFLNALRRLGGAGVDALSTLRVLLRDHPGSRHLSLADAIDLVDLAVLVR